MSLTYLGLGTNLGDRARNLEEALASVETLAQPGTLRVSSVYETPALLPPGAPSDWNLPYWNLVAEAKFPLAPQTLLQELQKIEERLGRGDHKRWAPRTIDLDILLWSGQKLGSESLSLPHPALEDRAFVLAPLAELAPDLVLPSGRRALAAARAHPKYQPRLMGIFNLTPDSFSDGGALRDENELTKRLAAWQGIAYLDLGGESTRPGAAMIGVEEEWNRLGPALEKAQAFSKANRVRPRLSVDTWRAETAARAIELGADVINDVSGLQDPRMLEVLKSSCCHYVLMHSLTVPADPRVHLDESRPAVEQVRSWMLERLELLDRAGIARSRIILDPGIGFGKTALQSMELLSRPEPLLELGLPVLYAHSRKSFLKSLAPIGAADRDPETLGVSFALASKGVDILRVHEPVLHHRSLLAWRHVTG